MALTTPSSTHTAFSLFNDLLPELRLKVYEFALATPGTLCFADEDFLQECDISVWSLKIFPGVALLRSSRKIYNEALPVFYAVNQFHFELFSHWEGSGRPTDLSKHTAMIRHLSVEAWVDDTWLDDLCASRLNELLHRSPPLHSFAFYVFRTYPRMTCPSLNETAKTLGDLRQRLRSMTIEFNFDEEENLQRLRDAIAPQDEWQHEFGDKWHSYSIGPSEQAGVRDMNRSECRIEEL